MTAGLDWLKAFPIVEADRAVKALLRAWADMAQRYRPNFHEGINEPKLTRVVRGYVRKRISVDMKLLGHWGTEGVENDIDFETGKVLKEGRTDISYTWNNEHMKFELVFEFKKLAPIADSRKRYLFNGVTQFVSGLYSEREPIALMVGILKGEKNETVSALCRAIASPATAAALKACEGTDGRFILPATLFPEDTQFDTEHLREVAKAPPHGTIRIAHAFVDFPYVNHTVARNAKRKRNRTVEEEE